MSAVASAVVGGRDAARRLPLMTAGVVLGLVVAIAALFAPLLATDPLDAGPVVHPDRALLPPGGAHWFGTDAVGRDIFSRVLFGARISLGIVVLVLVVSAVVGLTIGLTAGFVGGPLDAVLMRVTDVFLAFPALLLAVALSAVLSPSALHAAFAISATWWPWYARLARGQAAAIRRQGYSDAARVLGAGRVRQLLRHVLPNASTAVFVQMSLDAAGIILTAATLSYLGLGAQDPTPEWGLLTAQGQPLATTAWWVTAFPGLAILLTAFAFNVVGDGLQTVLDPKVGRAVIRIDDLRVAYGHRTVAHVPELTLDAGEVVGVAGESGSGKSQTALALLGLTRYTGARVTGSIRLDDLELATLPDRGWRELRGRRLAMILQSPRAALNPTLTLGTLFRRTLALHGVPRRDRRGRMAEALDEVVLDEELLRRYPHEVSGGQAQRFAIALVAALRAEVVVADEPTSALDVTVQSEVIDVLRRLRERHGTALLFISHDLAVIGEIADRIVVMRAGTVVEQGPVSQILTAPVHEYTRDLIASVPVIGSGPRLTALLLTVRPLLAVRDLRLAYGSTEVVHGIDLDVPSGPFGLGVIGESGSGKTTVARAVVRLHPVTGGSVMFGGADVATLTGAALAAYRRDVQIVFQDGDGALDPRMSVFSSVAEPFAVHRTVPRRERRDRVVALLEEVVLPADLLDRHPHQLSGGQRQRVVIARALALEPRLLVLDEPASALDVRVQERILRLVESLRERRRLAYVLISHNLAVVDRLCDSSVVLYRGTVMERGDTRALLTTPVHPYTRALRAAVPEIGVRRPPLTRLVAGVAAVSADGAPAGCVYAARCPLAEARCLTTVPALRAVEGRDVACHRAEDVGDLLREAIA